MSEDVKEILADGAREAVKRSPIIAMLILEIGILIYFGWALMSGSAQERAELRARNNELTHQLVECYRHRPGAGRTDVNEAVASVQNDSVK